MHGRLLMALAVAAAGMGRTSIGPVVPVDVLDESEVKRRQERQALIEAHRKTIRNAEAAKASAAINRHTGEVHGHAREKARRLRRLEKGLKS